MVRAMSKRMCLALLGALLAAGCSHGIGADGAGADRAALADVCADAPGRVPPARSTPARPDKRPRLSDTSAHISYLQPGDPWLPWRRAISPGHLGALFDTGYYLVTQAATPTGEYYASVLSGRVYPGPNQRTDTASRAMTIGGRPAYLTRFRIDYRIRGYAANSEVVTVLVIDTGRTDLALLYASIPDTAREYEPLVDQVVASVQV